MSKIIPLILAGGSGSRMWPLSREQYPKQLLKLAGEHSLLQNTARRLDAIAGEGECVVVCNEEYRFLVAQQLQEVGCRATIMLEPDGRNTAPAIALSAMQLRKDNPVLVVMPSDHIIQRVPDFCNVVQKAVAAAQAGHIVTFGIVPNEPNTGYGYIKSRIAPGVDVGKVEQFIEKPAQATAEAMLAAGDHFWNSGIFVFTAQAFLEELEKHAPQVYAACEKAVAGATADMDFIRPQKEAFLSSPSISIDYAVMEKTDKAVVIPFDGGWDDIGSWNRLWHISEKDAQQNVTIGDVLTEETRHSYLHATSRCVAVLGMEGVVVIETPDAVLVADQRKVQDIKKIVARLKEMGRDECMLHTRVYRPWGYYEGLQQGVGFQVKRLMINPGAKISLQQHEKRAEHWVVVKGVASITRGQEMLDLHPSQSTFIPVGIRHRVENKTLETLEIIEVQTGDYLGEDDIIRFDDMYGREVA